MFNIEEYILETGCLDIDYKRSQDGKAGGKWKKGKIEWAYEYKNPMKVIINIHEKKLCELKKDMSDIKVFNAEGIFKFRVVGGYRNFYVTLIEVLSKFGYKESDMMFKDYQSVEKDRLYDWEDYVKYNKGDENFIEYYNYYDFKIGGGLVVKN